MSIVGIKSLTVATFSQTPPSQFSMGRLFSNPSRRELSRRRDLTGISSFLLACDEARIEAREDHISVLPETLNRLALFIAAFPEGLPFPSPQILDDGKILLEWSKGPNLSVLLALSGSTKIHFASLIRGAAYNGNANFSGDRLPAEFLPLLHQWVAAT